MEIYAHSPSPKPPLPRPTPTHRNRTPTLHIYRHRPRPSIKFAPLIFYLLPPSEIPFEVPALQGFMQKSQFQQHPDFHITSSTILASTLRITRLNTRNSGALNTDMSPGPVPRGGAEAGTPRNFAAGFSGPDEQPSNGNPARLGNPLNMGGQPVRQPEAGATPGAMSSFSSLLLWILGGASSESLNSFLSKFRDFRDQGQIYAEPPQLENRAQQRTTDEAVTSE